MKAMTRMTMARMAMARFGDTGTCKIHRARPQIARPITCIGRRKKRWGARPRRPECKDKVRYYPGVPGLFWLKRRWALAFEVAASAPCANVPAH